MRAQLGWFFALTLIPIGQVVAIEFTMPIWTAILAAAFLGERMTVWKILAIVLGLIGVIVIVRPGDRRDQSGSVDRARRGGRLRHIDGAGQVAHPHRTARSTIIFWMLVVQSAAGFVSGALRLGMALGLRLGLDRRHRRLRHVLALLHGTRDALCRCDRGRADGFPAGPADRNRWLADLFGAAGSLHRARRGIDPDR